MSRWKRGEKIFDLEVVREELTAAEIDEGYDGERVQRVYLGTVFSLTPSGKYYMPWATGNLEACRACDGRGEVDAPLRQDLPAASADVLHKAAKALDWRVREIALHFYGAACEGRWPKAVRDLLEHTGAAVQMLQPKQTCDVCDGMGSEEAALDAAWMEQAEAELEEIGAALESGEGDPCDLFAVRSMGDEEE